MEILYSIFIGPFADMFGDLSFLIQVLWEGFVQGTLYALIALGFVLIFKASGVFNFAQGIMVVLAVLCLVYLHDLGVPAWLALDARVRREPGGSVVGRHRRKSDSGGSRRRWG